MRKSKSSEPKSEMAMLVMAYAMGEILSVFTDLLRWIDLRTDDEEIRLRIREVIKKGTEVLKEVDKLK